MLSHLSVKNYALIEELEIDFLKGFSVITGETGSGKSIMLGALGLILGERADLKALRNPNVKCVIEGTFELSEDLFMPFFVEHDIDFDRQSIIRREITPSGKSRAFINDTPVVLPVLKELGISLIDIHSQHQTLLLNKSSFQFDVFDASSKASAIKGGYLHAFYAYKSLANKLEYLIESERQANSDRDFIIFQLKDFEGLDLESLSESHIEEELSMLSNAEEVINLSTQVSHELNGNNSVIENLMNAEQALLKLSVYNKGYTDLLDRVKSAIIEITDIDEEVSRKLASIDVNVNRLTELTELFDIINRLQRKYNVTSVEELIKVKEDFTLRISAVTNLSDEIESLNSELNKKLLTIKEKGKLLSDKRQKGVSSFQSDVKNYLSKMAMPYAELKVELTPNENPSEFGLESIEFLVRTNKGSSFEPLKKVVSGGELSRIMLSIKSILSVSGNLPTIIFDEIDTGVSGEVANNMGGIMKKMANHLQVISITHLPQIASKGKQHYKVFKETKEHAAITKITKLNRDERLVEIAQMLSGENPSQAAIDNARELLN
ncbi:DNA repair protein RecN [bacterium]|nr:DNA repair protein RecN [bacterium]